MTALWYITWQRALTKAEERALTAHLPPRRLARLEQTRSPQQRMEVLCAYGLLRLALQERRGWSELPAVALTERGKPYFPDFPKLHFSISHTEGAALVGLSGAPIGVDIERRRPLPPRVRALLGEELDDAEALARWTALEAHAKRTGRGVGEFLHGSVALPPDCTCLAPEEGCVAGIACAGVFTVHPCTLEELFQ